MPNWVYNVLGAHDEQGRQFIFDNCINDKKNFTFNKMIPMPQILTIGCSPVRICNNFDEFKEKYGGHIDYTFEKEGMLICGYDSVMTQKCTDNLLKMYFKSENWILPGQYKENLWQLSNHQYLKISPNLKYQK